MPQIEELLRIAKDHGASDVHITVGIPPKMRVNGELITMDFPRMLPPDTRDVLGQIMNEVQLSKFEEKGEYDMSFSIRDLGRYRVNAYKQRGSVALALRLVGTRVPTAEELGLPKAVIDLYNQERGLVLVTGPTGSGKSTTLAAIIDKINNNRDAHIITLEDPIEYLHQHNMSIVNQREIGLDSQNYANALRAALREDPDVILVGEMRDYETISVAITAAETGHLVLSTLHTIGAASTVDRVIDVFPPHQQQQIRIQFANVLEAVVSQQLIPRLDGQGRIAAYEVMIANPAIRNQIRDAKTHMINGTMQQSKNVGNITMDDAIRELCDKKLIDPHMAARFAIDEELMRRRLNLPMT